jgi:hypothetical protein
MAKPLWAGAAALGVGLFLKSELMPSYAAAVGVAAGASFVSVLFAMKLDVEDEAALRGLARRFRPLARWFPAPSA